MGIQVTLDVPENIYHEAAQLAQETQRTVDDVLKEIVIRSFPAFYVDPDQDKMQSEVHAFEEMHAKLWEKYPNQYVAIYQSKVIDHDTDERALLDRLDSTHPDEVVLVRKVLPELPGELVFRSPRFALAL